MSDAAARDGSMDVGSAPGPRLVVVPPVQAAETPSVPDEPNVGRSAAIGAAIGFFAGTCIVAVACALTGLDLGSSIGLGIFVGMWGGAGFGFMVGGTIPLARQADAIARRNHVTERSHRAG